MFASEKWTYIRCTLCTLSGLRFSPDWFHSSENTLFHVSLHHRFRLFRSSQRVSLPSVPLFFSLKSRLAINSSRGQSSFSFFLQRQLGQPDLREKWLLPAPSTEEEGSSPGSTKLATQNCFKTAHQHSRKEAEKLNVCFCQTPGSSSQKMGRIHLSGSWCRHLLPSKGSNLQEHGLQMTALASTRLGMCQTPQQTA